MDSAVAIIGLACRTAGADDPEGLWRLLGSERRMIRPVPDHRVPGIDPGPVKTGGLHAALLDDIAGFDAAFFGISRRMAAWMDPHHRMLLELTWHALESAAIAPERLRGLPVAVFAGAPMSDYRECMIRAGVVDGAAFPGTLITYSANRISYYYDWTGPSYAVDSACSSGVSVLAPAVQGLRAKDFPVAAVMAANITCNGFYTSSAYQAGALSPTGRSVPFSTVRDGYIRGEGGACLLLKRLDEALADGDPVHAVIRGVGVGHNGRAGGLTGSDAAAQAQLIERTARLAAVPVESIGYIEAHGTGTGGDLAEVQGVIRASGGAGDHARHGAGPDGKLWIGSVKSSIGHLEGAAGLLGLVKAVLILRYGRIPKVAGLDRIDPAIASAVADTRVALADRSLAWPLGEGVRRIGVNSFGVGGSLAHALIEDAPAASPAGEPFDGMRAPGAAMLFPLSAADQSALRALAGEQLAALGTTNDVASLAWTLQTGRAGLRVRRLLVARHAGQLRNALAAVASGGHDQVVAAPGDALLPQDLPELVAQDAGDWLAGKPVDWAKHWPRPWPARCPYLPGYPFQRAPHWFNGKRADRTSVPAA